MTRNQWIGAVLGALLLLATGYGLGIHSKPDAVMETAETESHSAKLEQENSTLWAEVNRLGSELTHTKQNVTRDVVTVVRKDGTQVTHTHEKIDTATQTETKTAEVAHVETAQSKTAVAQTDTHTVATKTVTYAKPSWIIGGSVGLFPQTMETSYGLYVQHRFLGPIFLGVGVQRAGQRLGVSALLSLEF